MAKVAIIGAGLAGLTVGLRLHQKNYDIDIYEARERVGGRVFTVQMQNASGEYSIAEAGGQNIADGGTEPHVVTLAEELGLKIEEKTVRPSWFIHDHGKYKNLDDLLSQLDLPESKVDELSKNCASIAELLDKLLVNHGLLKMALTTKMIAYEGLNTKEQSLHHNLDTLKCMLEGGLAPAHDSQHDGVFELEHKSICGGNAKLPLKIAEVLGNRIHLNKALAHVTKQDQKIKLSFADNSFAYCDKLILAMPASVYRDVKFEDEIVPSSQLQKIHSIKYGANHKLLMPIHRKSTDYKIITTDKQLSFFNEDLKVMVMYFIDDDIMHTLAHQINTVQKGYEGLEILNKNLTHAKDLQFIKYDTAVTHSWLSDPYSKGSYSGYDNVLCASLDDQVQYKHILIKEIFKPVDDRIFFIGEHATTLDAIGTMNAAVESGERIARLF